MKEENEQLIKIYVQRTITPIDVIGCGIKGKVHITYKWYEENKRRDLDNIAFAKKFIQDALVKLGVLKGDSWRHIAGFTDEFYMDKENPRIEVIITEV